MSTKDFDDLSYRQFIGPQVYDKAVHTLEGILRGIGIDNEVSGKELNELLAWCNDYRKYSKLHPFNEVIPLVDSALDDGVLDPEETNDILFMCKNISTDSHYYDVVTSDIQRLQGILHGIVTDHNISKSELDALSDWIDSHDHLKGVYPYDEIESLVVSVLRDGIIHAKEHKVLTAFFEDFIQFSLATQVRRKSEKAKLGVSDEPIKLSGIFALCPEISFEGRSFCLTGMFRRAKRSEVASHISKYDGICKTSMSKAVDYLVVGSAGNPAWAFSCYGRKIQQAIDYRKEKSKLLIIHENDFWDAIEDQ